jgi:hypothetical protein
MTAPARSRLDGRLATRLLLALFTAGVAWYLWVHRGFPDAAARLQ